MGEDNHNKSNRIKNDFNAFFKAQRSQSFIDICRKAYGDQYPEELEPNSFITRTELNNFIRFLNFQPNEKIIDIGCGRGGPGMWIAHSVNANYFGLDVSEMAIKKAASRIKKFDLEGRAQFKVGDICATTFPDNYFDAAISIDVLMFIPNVSTAISEVSRILRPGALFLFTTWEKKRPSKLNDYRLFLPNARFTIEIYEEIPDWERQQCEYYQLVLDNKDILIKDMGREASRPIINEAELYLPVMKFFRRVFVVAAKKI